MGHFVDPEFMHEDWISTTTTTTTTSMKNSKLCLTSERCAGAGS